MKTYYRFTNNNNPMSDWGHAMFSEDREEVVGYGENEYIITCDKTVSIYDLENEIKNAWEYCIENENFGVLYETKDYLQISSDTIFNSFAPHDIVDSAQGYDCDFVAWLWDFVLEPKNIMAVRTQNGVVCFDEDLIIKV